MKANVSIVAKGIANSDCHPAIKKCLSALFNFELENTIVKNPPYKEKYREILDANLGAWEQEEGKSK
jgi:hypothetical protein